MFDHLSEYLEKFKYIKNKGNTNKKIIVKCVRDETKINIYTEDIDVSGNTAYINTNPKVRSEIFIKKKEILRCIRETNGLLSIVDVR